MTPLWICPPANAERRAALCIQLEEWTSSAAISELVRLTGGAMPNLDLPLRLRWLADFSSRWDFRAKAREQIASQVSASQDAGGSSRWEIRDTGLGADDEAKVVALADQLGLVSNHGPQRRNVDYLLILGGARLSNLLRPQYAGELLANSTVEAREIVLLGGSRPVMESERDATNTYAPDAETEFDLLTEASAKVFGFDPSDGVAQRHRDPDSRNADWQVWRFPADATTIGLPVTAIEAPSREPSTRRANTADSYHFFAKHLSLRKQAACLLVTSQIYVLYQHLEAVRSLALPFELELETAGFPTTWHAELQGMQGAVNYLQETRSTVLSAHRLFEADLETTFRKVATEGSTAVRPRAT